MKEGTLTICLPTLLMVKERTDIVRTECLPDVSLADQGRFIQVGQDLTGVSAPPGNTPA